MRIVVSLCCLLLMPGCEHHPPGNEFAKAVFASVETEPVANSDDAADDPAIWIHPERPEESLLLGTNKQLGLAVYNLAGKQVQFIRSGRLNNVDLRQGVNIDGTPVDIAVATNRTTMTIDVFKISPTGRVQQIFSQPVDLSDPYGICMHLDAEGSAFVFANSKDGLYQQWSLNPKGKLKPKLIGSFQLNSQPEGCAVDDKNAVLYLGEENRGIWKMPANVSHANEKVLIDTVGNGYLVADVEGMDIYQNPEGDNLLVVSSQGNNSYAIYQLSETDTYLGSIKVVDSNASGIDGAEETDGLAVTSVNLGGKFSEGLLVVQDGINRLPNQNQNFKVISWNDISQVLQLSEKSKEQNLSTTLP